MFGIRIEQVAWPDSGWALISRHGSDWPADTRWIVRRWWPR